MVEEYEKQKRKRVSLMRSVLDYGMGIMIVIAGIFFLFRTKIPTKLNDRFPPNEIDIVFGSMCILYGSWRIYRGYKKNYFR
jgi:hypothetical protein